MQALVLLEPLWDGEQESEAVDLNTIPPNVLNPLRRVP